MIRLRRPTIVECITIIVVIAILAGLVFIPDAATATRRDMERRARDWKPIVAPNLKDGSLLDTEVSLAGQWHTPRRLSHTEFTFDLRTDGRYNVRFRAGGCGGGCELSRTATLTDGVILFDGAVVEYSRKTYNSMVAIRLDNVQYLLPAESVADFERELATGTGDWKWYVHSRNRQDNEK